MSGTLYAVGVGPGDPELLTLKAVRLIGSGALIAYPKSQDNDTSLARMIAADFIPHDASEFGFTIPMRVAREPAREAYDKVAAYLQCALQEEKDVVLLCEGDPFFYGSAMYVVERLAAQFSCEIIPGISSISACAAAIKCPLAARNDRLKVLPAPLDQAILAQELADSESAAIIKIGRHFDRIRNLLDKMNLTEQAIIIEHATGSRERIFPLGAFPSGKTAYFSTILIYKSREPWEALIVR